MRLRGGASVALALLAGCWSPGVYRAEKPAGKVELVLPPAFPAPAPPTATALSNVWCEPIPTAFAKSVEGASALPTRRRRAEARPEEFARDPRGDRWLQGRVSRVPVGAQCRWKLQFAPPAEQNPFAGAALLEGFVRDDLHDGDLVQAEGSFLPTPPGQPPAYRCTGVAVLSGKSR